MHTLARGREIEYLSLSIYLSFFFVFLQGRELLLFKNSFFLSFPGGGHTSTGGSRPLTNYSDLKKRQDLDQLVLQRVRVVRQCLTFL